MMNHFTDAYPSRQSTEILLLGRHDPVVHGGVDDGPLTSTQLAEFDARGFLQVDDVFTSDEVHAMRSELQRMTSDPAIRSADACIVERDSDVVRSVFDLPTFSDLLHKVLRDPRVSDVARQVLGSDVYLHQTRINYKPGFVGNPFEWHSDFETWHVEDGMPRPRALSASIALTDNHEQNGPLLIMPGSHHTYVTCVGATPEDNYRGSLRQQEAGVPDETSLTLLADRHGIESCRGAAGSVVFFDSNCMHGSNGNITPFPRSNVFAVYNSVDNILEDPFGPTTPRPTWVASRDFTPLAT